MLNAQTAIADTLDGATAEFAERPIDLVHLARMTLGDRSLEREVLELFARQSALLLARMNGTGPDEAGALAHTLKGSARGIGAWRVAAAAEALEFAPPSRPEEAQAALVRLAATVAEARGIINELLRAN